jgi:septum formation protein
MGSSVWACERAGGHRGASVSMAGSDGEFSVALRDNLGMSAPALILASTSRYRRELLERLQLPFEAVAPGVDEAPLPHEAPAALAQRLALAKAQAVAAQHPGAVVIGSDQVADLAGQAIGKPHTHERAVQQLRAMSGQSVVFQTAVAVVRRDAGVAEVRLSPVVVRFRELQDEEIEHYLRREQPYDCAGSAKSEGLGITLLRSVESTDPTALIGLPLTTVCELMRVAGLDPLRSGLNGSTQDAAR